MTGVVMYARVLFCEGTHFCAWRVVGSEPCHSPITDGQCAQGHPHPGTPDTRRGD